MLESFLSETSRNLAVSNSLADCQTFASLFDNTCSATADQNSLTKVPTITMSCTGEMRCPVYNDFTVKTYSGTNKCPLNRQLCVKCFEQDGATFIRYQSNNIPNHCVTHSINAIAEGSVDFTVKFNRDVQGEENIGGLDYNSQEEVDELICDLQRTSSTNLPEESGYTNKLETTRLLMNHPPPDGSRPPPDGQMPPPGGMQGMDGQGGPREPNATAGAFALSGLPIYNGLDANANDAIVSEWESMDACLSHSQKQGGGHYHNWSPCITKNGALAVTGGALKAPGMCKDHEGCKSGKVADYSL